MKYVKILSLVAVAAMALMAFAAGSASATALYNGTTKLTTGSTLDFTVKSGTKAKLTSTDEKETFDECSGSTAKGTTTNESGANIEGNLSELTWTGCTVPTSTDAKGGLKVSQIGSSTEGTVKSNAEIGVTINTIFFGVCRYGVAAETHLGVIKTSATGTGEFVANAVAIKQAGSEALCPSTAKWVANYVSTTPDNLRVEAS